MTANVSVGDRDIALANQIIRVEVGSTAHGMGTGADDLDPATCATLVQLVDGLVGRTH